MLTQPSTTAADDTTTRPRHQCSTAEASSTLALHFPAAEHDWPPAAQDAAAAASVLAASTTSQENGPHRFQFAFPTRSA